MSTELISYLNINFMDLTNNFTVPLFKKNTSLGLPLYLF